MDNLDTIADAIRSDIEEKNTIRDKTLARSRGLIRHCANTIRAIHRQEWEIARSGLETIRASSAELVTGVAEHPDLFYSGYTQDALKELAEAFTLYALVKDEPVPTPEELGIPGSTYLNGLCEAASELRRTVLDLIRRGEGGDRAEELLDKMDAVYNILMAFDFPDAVTGGLRRRVDALRGVLSRTRGDLTNNLRQQHLVQALCSLEGRLRQAGLDVDSLDKQL